MANDPAIAMMAQVALSYGDAINSYRLIYEHLSLHDAVEILSQSPKYKKILPKAFEVYTQNGEKIGKAIANFPEFTHRRAVARELSDLLDDKNNDAINAAKNLENHHLQEQLSELEKGFPDSYGGHVKPVIRLAVKNAIYGQYQTTDRILAESLVDHQMVYTLQLAIDRYKPDVYPQIIDEVFSLHAELDEKENIKIMNPGIQANDIDLTKALRSFANKYQHTIKKEHDWTWFMPMFSQSPDRYSWDGNSFTDTVRRTEALFETGRAAFVDRILSRINRHEIGRFGPEQICEDTKEILEYAEKIKDANLPNEIYIAFGTEFDRMSLVEFTKGILQEKVLERIRALDKLGPHLSKTAIGYTATHEPPENVLYVAEHILDVTRLGKAKQIFKSVMSAGRNGYGADRLRTFLPDGINLRKLSDAGKKLIKEIGFRADRTHITTIHDVLRENQSMLRKMSEYPQRSFPWTYSSMEPASVRAKYEEFLGIKNTEAR